MSRRTTTLEVYAILLHFIRKRLAVNQILHLSRCHLLHFWLLGSSFLAAGLLPEASAQQVEPEVVIAEDLAVVVEAEPAPTSAASPATGAETPQVLDEIVIEAERSTSPGLTVGRSLRVAGIALQPVTEMSGDKLARRAQGTLGETLAWEPGVSSTSFSPGASRPVIRGFDGFRVRTLRDDLGTMDLSDTSPDHGIGVEPLLAESLEVHRGPSALLYGNSAIGGAVNIRSRTLARELPLNDVTGSLDSRFETAAPGWSQSGFASLTHGDWVLQITGSARETDDVRIPGRARTADYERAEQPRVSNPGAGSVTPLANPDGILPNSDTSSRQGSIGLSWLPQDSPFWLGLSWSGVESAYGLPFFFSGDPTDFQGDYDIQMRQSRFDLEAGLDLDLGPLKKIQLRLAQSDYAHDELFIGTGRDHGIAFVETGMAKSSVEGRLDVLHGGMAGRLEGLVGLHGYGEDFDASRLIVPPPTEQRVGSAFHTQNLGLYTLQKLRLTDRWQLQLGGRWETQEIEDDSLAGLVPPTVLEQESLSGALGLTWSREQWAGMKKFSLTGILSSTERIPTATERYSFWNNAGLGRFLVGGDLDGRPLGLEKSLGFELGLAAEWERASLKLNGFRYDYENFIFLQELPNFIQRAVQYIEREAVIQGFEGQLDCRLWEKGTRRLQLSLLGDYVHGQNTTDDEPLPRIPPLRIGARLEFTTGALTFGLEARHSFAQNRLKPEPRGELPTGDFTMVNADASWRFLRGRHDVMLTFQLSNLLDQDARQHTSFRKDVAPLPGLGASAAVRWSF